MRTVEGPQFSRFQHLIISSPNLLHVRDQAFPLTGLKMGRRRSGASAGGPLCVLLVLSVALTHALQLDVKAYGSRVSGSVEGLAA
jgi:hypothetical protein